MKDTTLMSTPSETTPDLQPNEGNFDLQLRPKSLEEFVGQSKLKSHIALSVAAAKKRGEPLEHVLLYGNPGLGKTTLAHIISSELGRAIRVTSGPVLERAGDLAAILTNLGDGDILFVDECHRINPLVAEVLYPAMEDFALDLVLGKGPSAKTIRIDLPHFTLIGATTRASLLPGPMRDRFGLSYHLDFYELSELIEIVRRSATLLGLPLDGNASQTISERARRTPRVANRLLKRVRDYAEVHNLLPVTPAVVENAMHLLDIDHIGLDAMDRKILETLIEKFHGGPAGLQAIAASTAEEMETLETIYEPYLMHLGLIDRTPRGRVATARAYEHLGRDMPQQQKLQMSNGNE